MDKLLAISVRYLKGVGPRKAKQFKRLGINTLEDLFYCFPKRYEDRSKLQKISQLKEGEYQAIRVKVCSSQQKQSWRRRSFEMIEATFADTSGKIHAVWFNQSYLKNYLTVGKELILYGKTQIYKGRLQMQSPEFEIVDDKNSHLNAGSIVPIYTLVEGMTQRYLRKVIRKLLDEFISKIKDTLPYDIRKRHNLLNQAQSLINIHFPKDDSLQKEAYRRLSFEEFFLYQIPILMRKIKRDHKRGIAHKTDGDIFKLLIDSFPFNLTPAQDNVIKEIKKDMASSFPMQRLLQGEVASGKTVVALLSAAIALDGGYQVAFMVPTEILATQHYITIKKQIAKIKHKINVGLLTSSLKKADKERIYKNIKQGRLNLLIGTHSLLGENVKFKNLGLVIIDEQHKFGVGQRALLPGKGNSPDCLIMTATPIPRTLSLTIYGDLDISTIDQLPKGRLPVESCVYEADQRSEVYRFAIEKVRDGRQVYVVCPTIEESEVLGLRSAQDVYLQVEHIVTQNNDRHKIRVGLVHGRLKQVQQDEIMRSFKKGLIDILVATTVIEVGIDVANASVMIIEEAQSFGLAQLHQLRGRIGRGNHQSYCLFVADPKTDEAARRIEAISSLSDGFKIAEIDLKIRGPGEFFGRRQHGLTELKIGNPLKQMQLLKDARVEAHRLLEADFNLEQRQNLELRQVLKSRFPEYEELMMVG